MPTKRIRGDAVAVAQVTRIAPPVNSGAVSLVINGKALTFPSWDIAAIVSTWNAGTTGAAASPEFLEITASADGSALLLTADTPGRPFAVRVFSGDQDITNSTSSEVQTITVANAPTGGTFTLTFGGNTTAGIAHNATAATVQTALQGLASIGAGNALVTGPAGGPWVVAFAGALAAAEQPLLVATPSLTGGNSTITIETLADGATGTNEVQTVALNGSPSAGTFTLSFAGSTTGAIARNANAATVQAALEALPTIGTGGVACTGGPLPAAVTCTFQGARAAQALPQMTGDGSGLTSSLTATVTETTPGAAGLNLRIDGGVTTIYGNGATWRWEWIDGATTYQSTSTISPASTPAQVAAALCELPNVGTGNVTGSATGGPDPSYKYTRLEFVGALAGRNPVTLNWGKFRLRAVSAAWPAGSIMLAQAPTGTNEIQTVALGGSPTAGTFTLSYAGQTTAPIAHNATASAVRAALEALTTIGAGGVTCTGGALPGSAVVVEFSGNGLQCQNLALMTISAANLNPAVTTTVEGVTGQSETQRLTLGGSPYGGTLTLTLSGQTTGNIAWNASAGTVQTALEALGAIGAGKAPCSGGPWPGTPIVVSFDRDRGNLAQLTGTLSLNNATMAIAETVKGGVTFGVIEATRSRGPSHWDDPTNWSPAGIPDSLDVAALDSGDASILYGLQQRTTFTADAATDFLTLASGVRTFQTGQIVQVRSTGTLPAGLTAATNYYVIAAGVAGGAPADNRLQLSASLNGPPVNITNAGTGTHTIAVALAALRAPSLFAGELGLPQRDDAGTWEYRPLSLEIDVATVTIGEGSGAGNGSGLIKLDTGTAPVAVTVFETGGATQADGYALEWIGDNAANTWTQYSGECAIAHREGQTATLAAVYLRGGTLEMGRAVAAATVNKTAGTLIVSAATLAGALTLRD